MKKEVLNSVLFGQTFYGTWENNDENHVEIPQDGALNTS